MDATPLNRVYYAVMLYHVCHINIAFIMQNYDLFLESGNFTLHFFTSKDKDLYMSVVGKRKFDIRGTLNTQIAQPKVTEHNFKRVVAPILFGETFN